MSAAAPAPEPDGGRCRQATGLRRAAGALVAVFSLACVLLGLSPRLADGATASSVSSAATSPPLTTPPTAQGSPPTAAGSAPLAAEVTVDPSPAPVAPGPGSGPSGPGHAITVPAAGVDALGGPTRDEAQSPSSAPNTVVGAPLAEGTSTIAPDGDARPTPTAGSADAGEPDLLGPAAAPSPPPPSSSTSSTPADTLNGAAVSPESASAPVPPVTETLASANPTPLASPQSTRPGPLPSALPATAVSSSATTTPPDPATSSALAANHRAGTRDDGDDGAVDADTNVTDGDVTEAGLSSGPDTVSGQGRGGADDPSFAAPEPAEQRHGPAHRGDPPAETPPVEHPALAGAPTNRSHIVAIRALPHDVASGSPSVTLAMPWSTGPSVEIELEPGRMLGASSLWLAVVVVMLALWLPNPLDVGLRPGRRTDSSPS